MMQMNFTRVLFSSVLAFCLTSVCMAQTAVTDSTQKSIEFDQFEKMNSKTPTIISSSCSNSEDIIVVCEMMEKLPARENTTCCAVYTYPNWVCRISLWEFSGTNIDYRPIRP